MKLTHAPRVNLRYWTAITLCSVFGTNMGDYYAHESGLGILKGLVVLAIITAILFAVERFDNLSHQAYYWLVIVIIRTGATNIADGMMYKMRLPEIWLNIGWAAFIVVFALFTRTALAAAGDKSKGALPITNAFYWLAMLGCGVFGTVCGDTLEHAWGEGPASIILLIAQIILLAIIWKRTTSVMALYWIPIAFCRTTGTAIGDFFAESKSLNIGLPLTTLCSGIVFFALLLIWKGSTKEAPVPAQAEA